MHSVQSSACLVHSEINMTTPGVLYSHVSTIYSEDHLRSFWYKMTAIIDLFIVVLKQPPGEHL